MEFFHRAKTVRLKSHHNKFLVAADDEENLKQHDNGAAPAAKWIVERVEGKPNAIRLKSNSSWKYLSVIDDPHLLGWTGKRAVQGSPRLKSNACVEWEPIKEGPFVKLRAHRGTFLRANGGLPPWRHSVTHDITTKFQDWVLWVVDILEIDHTAEAAAEQGKKQVNDTAGTSDGGAAVDPPPPPPRASVSSNSSGSKTASPAGSFRSVRTPSPERQEMDAISRTSSNSSIRETPISSYSAAPSISEPAEEFSSPYIKKLINSSKNSRQSNSFNHLESVIADADELLDGRRQKKKVPERDPSPTESVQSHASSRHTPLEVRMAKQTLAEAKDLDFESILASGKLKRVEKAIAVLIADESGGRSRTGNHTKLLNLRDQLQALRSERERAGIEMEEYEAFGVRKADMKADLQKEVGRARELQRREEELSDAVEGARRRRDELVRQLERLEMEIREAEDERAVNEQEIVEVCTVIGRRNAGVKDMEREEEAWGRRKKVAEERLRQVEDDWGVFKVSLQMFEC